MRKYRKKPVVIEAVRYTGTPESHLELQQWMGAGPLSMRPPLALFIETLEGTMHVSPGDYVIRGVQGEYYPCKPDIFEASYEELTQ